MEVPMNSAQSSAHFPVQHRSLSLDIKGNKRDIVISKYEDIFLVIVTQIGCMGTMLAAKKDGSVFSDPTYNVNVLFGKRDEVRSLDHQPSKYHLNMHGLTTVQNFVTAERMGHRQAHHICH
uniref:Uncharacterized protein n=1 Tax=Setaria viridis TaxID=4556 RepID=A0A4U6U765_SETVI|nr:hypothetical protein SEVIR_6G159500v2 [Setaria viridis]